LVLTEQMNFWGELINPDASVDRLDDVSSQFARFKRQASDAFDEILKINGSSSSMLRRFGVFQDEVCNEVSKSTKLFAQADEMDAMISKEHANIGSAIVMFSKVC
jgi:hypothetical protein